MGRALTVFALVMMLAGCTVFQGRPPQEYFVLFFAPGTTTLAPEAQQIVRQAAYNARLRKPSRIEIAVPPDTPGGVRLVEGRTTAIQNILSAEGTDSKLLAIKPPSDEAASIAAAQNRAEIRLLP